MQVHRHTFCGLAVVASLAGCTAAPAPPTAPPTTTTTTTSTATTTRSGEPRPTEPPPVSTPIDLRPLAPHPCAVIDEQQQSDLGLRPAPYESIPPAETTNDMLTSCGWSDPPGPHQGESYGYRFRAHFADDPLAEAYRTSNDTLSGGELAYPVFTPRTIGDLPAVIRTGTELTFSCEIVIGAGNGQGLVVEGVRSADPTLCDRMTALATLVVDAVRG